MKEILEILENDPKIKPKEIATMTGLTEAQVASKIKEMEKNGIIRKYKTVIDWEKAGEEYVYAIIELKVVLRSRTGYDAIAERIAALAVRDERAEKPTAVREQSPYRALPGEFHSR